MQPQQRQRGIGQPGDRSGGGRVPQHHGKGQRGDVFSSLTQGAQGQREHVEPVKQIGPKAPLGHFGGQIAVGASDNPHVDLDRLGRADRHHLTFLQGAQQLGLQRQRHLGNFVEQQSAAISGAEEPFVGLARSGERALAVAEQQSLQHRFGHRGAVDCHERPGGARAAGMDKPAEHFLAGAGWSTDQHRNFAGGQAFGQRQHRQRFGISRNRHSRRGQRGEQRGKHRIAGRIAVGQAEGTARASAAQLIAVSPLQTDAGAGAGRRRFSGATQRRA